MAEFLDDIHLMGDDHHSDAQLRIQSGQKFQNGFRSLGVQCAGCLIAKQEVKSNPFTNFFIINSFFPYCLQKIRAYNDMLFSCLLRDHKKKRFCAELSLHKTSGYPVSFSFSMR